MTINLATGEPIRISQPSVFRQVGYEPHIGQRHFHAAKQKARFRALPSGRRWGKSQGGGHELTVAAHVANAVKATLEPKGKRHEYWIVGPEYSDAEKEFRVVYNDLLKQGAEFDRPGTYYSEGGGDMDISLFGGRFLVHAKSAKYPKTLVGEGLMGVIMAEAAKLKAEIWDKYMRPMLADFAREGSWAIFSSTPEGKNWFYDMYMRGQDPFDEEVWSRRAPSWENHFLFPMGREDPEIISMEKSMSQEKFKQEIGADFTEFVGRVFKDFSEETHLGDFEYNPRLPLYLASDKGYRAPSVVLFLQVDVWDNIRVIGEYYMAQRDAGEVAQDIKEDPRLGPMLRYAAGLYPDPASPEWASTLSNAWSVPVRGNTGGDLLDRIDLIRRWLKPWPLELEDGHPEKLPRLMIDRTHCPNTIREMNNYRYPEEKRQETETKEHPLKVDDHTPEALGRFMVSNFGPHELNEEKTTVSKARMGGRR